MSNLTKPLRWYERLFSKAWITRFLAKVLHHLDKPLLRWSHGKISLTNLITGLPMITITTIGCKSGLPRTMPLLAIRDQDRFVLVASYFGGKHNPGWYYNLKANPTATVLVDEAEKPFRARIVTGEERERYWQMAVDLYRGYAAYAKMASHRTIPVIVLEPET